MRRRTVAAAGLLRSEPEIPATASHLVSHPSATARTLGRVLLTDYAWPDLEIERRILTAAGCELVVAPARDEATLAHLAADVQAIMTNWAPVTARVLAAAPQCRIVCRLGIGLDNIDVAEATRRGMLVTNVPDYCVIEVAEHALALLLAMARKVARYHWDTKQGRYELLAGPRMHRICGQTLGIVGLGHIGRALAERAQALGLRVLATRRRAEPCPLPGVELVSLERLLVESDFVSLHAPLTAETRGMIGAAELARLKPTAYLINTARGGLVDHRALGEAIVAGRLAGAALDVQEQEPPDLSQPPYGLPEVIVTPHAAFTSEESLANLRSRVAAQVVACLSGGEPENIVNRVKIS